MEIRTIVTDNSVWKFDLGAMRYLRLPKSECPNPLSEVPYTGDWDDFTRIVPMGDRVMVYRPVPLGSGALRQTGAIEFDSHPGPWPLEEE